MNSINGLQDLGNNILNNNDNNNLDKFIYINIILEKGIKKQIRIDKKTNIGDLSFEFCKTNNLDFQNLMFLKNEIEKIQKNIYGNEIKEYYDINLYIKSQNNSFRKNSEEIKIIDQSEGSNNYFRKNKSPQNLNNSFKRNQKLFPYELKINKSFNKKRNKNSPIEMNYSLNPNYKSNTVKNISNINLNKKEYRISLIDNNNLKNNLKQNSLNQNLTRNSSYKKRDNIFERLFLDSEIKRISYKRPCHFSSTLRNSSFNINNSSHILDNNNSIQLSTNKLNNNLTLISSYSNFNNPNINYNKSYIFKQMKSNMLNSKLKQYFKRKNKKKIHQRNLNNNEQSINNLYYNPIRNYNNCLINKKSNSNTNIYNTVNIPNENQTINKIKVNNYIPLKNKNLLNINQSGDLFLEHIRNEAFINLFIELNNNSKDLNQNNLKIDTIPSNLLHHIEPIISEIYKNRKVYQINDFVLEMRKIFKNFTMEEKRNFVNLYKNKNEIQSYSYINTAPVSGKRNIKKNIFNLSQLKKKNSNKRINNSLVNYSNDRIDNQIKNINYIHNSKLISGIEKKRNFFYIN